MGGTLRDFGSILVGYAGFAVGGPLGAAVATVLFNYVLPPKAAQGGSLGAGGGTRETAVGTAIPWFGGHYMREGGECLRCSKNKKGERTGIKVRTKTKNVGGSGGGGGQKTKTEKQFLCASFGFAEGPGYVDKVIEHNQTKGKKVIYDRFGDPEDNKYDFAPIYGPVSGDVIGYVSERIRIYYGTEEQPFDDAEQSWDYEEGVSSDRGIIKIVFNEEGPLEAGTTYEVRLSNDLNSARDIIAARLRRGNIPASRIDLSSIDENVTDFGWYVEGLEPARQLAEEIAAFHFHDLHFMATAQGLMFTDISRPNPTIIELSEREIGAFSTSNGEGQPISSSTINWQSAEKKPRELKVGFKNWNKNYKDDGVTITWTSANGEAQSVSLRCVATLDQVFDFGEIAMRELQAALGTVEIALMPHRLQVAPGIVLKVPEPSPGNPNGYFYLRVVSQKISPEGILTCSCTFYDPAVYGAVDTPPLEIEPEPTTPSYGTPEIFFLNGVSLTDEMTTTPVVLCCGRVPDEKDFGTVNVDIEKPDVEGPILQSPAVCGVLSTAYTYDDHHLYFFDYSRSLIVDLDEGGSLSSTTETAVLNDSANILWVNGFYLSFTVATALSPRQYRITGLMPGIGGSDDIRAAGVGSRVIKITDETGDQEEGVFPVEWPKKYVGRALSWTAENVDNSKKHSSGSTTCTAKNMKVLAPSPDVVVGGDDEGGLVLRFYARTRLVDAAEQYFDAGLPFEHVDPFVYTVRLLADNGDELDERVVTSDSSELTAHYSAGEVNDIFGGMPSVLRGEIYGANSFGKGFVRAFVI